MAKGITNEAERSDSKTTKEKPSRRRREADSAKRSPTARAARPTTAKPGAARQVPVSNDSGRAAQPRKSTTKTVSAAVRKDWRQSEITTFLFGLVIIEGVVVLVSHYSTYKQWMAPVSLLIGVLYAVVFVVGGSDK